MRHDSERVPGKNFRPLGGRPLFHHIVSTLVRASRVDRVVIDTDSALIKDDARRSFPGVLLVDRPEPLRAGTTSMNDVLFNTIEHVDADVIVQTHSTNPLLTAETIDEAIAAFRQAADRHDSLFGVTRRQTRLWWPDGRGINHDPRVLLRTQDLPPIYEENSCLYVFRPEILLARGNRIGERPLMFEIPKEEAFDIDDEIDWRVIEALFARQVTP